MSTQFTPTLWCFMRFRKYDQCNIHGTREHKNKICHWKRKLWRTPEYMVSKTQTLKGAGEVVKGLWDDKLTRGCCSSDRHWENCEDIRCSGSFSGGGTTDITTFCEATRCRRFSGGKTATISTFWFTLVGVKDNWE